MTKYILAGGNDLRHDDYGRRVAVEVYRDLPRPVRLVSCFFATPSEFWNVKAKTWRPWFECHFGGDVIWEYARSGDFLDKVKASDVVYLHGGDNDLLHRALDEYAELPAQFDGKIVIGSSAGANYLSRHFWRRHHQEFGRGRGIVPLSIMVHYGANEPGAPVTDWDEVETELAAFDGDEPLKLREGFFKVVEL